MQIYTLVESNKLLLLVNKNKFYLLIPLKLIWLKLLTDGKSKPFLKENLDLLPRKYQRAEEFSILIEAAEEWHKKAMCRCRVQSWTTIKECFIHFRRVRLRSCPTPLPRRFQWLLIYPYQNLITFSLIFSLGPTLFYHTLSTVDVQNQRLRLCSKCFSS